ncbi:MAG: hypothetical protein LBI91_03310 [Spirochaetaceae bacterium]|jgi:hypothetical protein|nr:hypothetical protein [Spirochaetaceae bacterium]
MKRLSAILAVGLFFSGLCFAQTQTGPASYNASKSGLTISHASLSFSRKVKITNLQNNMEVIAAVDGRISPGGPAIADISREAGDVIGMSHTGYTVVRIEIIPPEAAPSQVSAQPVSEPPEPPAAAPANPPPPVAQPYPPATQEPRVETIQLISPSQPQIQPQYIVVPSSAQNQNCFSSPLCVAILVLLIIGVLLLVAILVLILWIRRIPWLPWYYPVWARRRLRYMKKRVI